MGCAWLHSRLRGRSWAWALAVAFLWLPSSLLLAGTTAAPDACFSYLQALSDHGSRLDGSDRLRFKAITEAPPAKFNAQNLLDFLGHGLALKRLFELHPGVKEYDTVGAHTKDVLELFDHQFDHWKLGELAKHLGITPERLRALLRTAVALHDVGKGLAVEANASEKQHAYTTPLLVETLRQLQFTEKEIQLAKALIDQDHIGKLLQRGESFPKAVEGLKRAAKEAGIPEEDFFRLASALFASDAGTYQRLRDYYFQKVTDLKVLGRTQASPDAPAFHALADAFKVEVPKSKSRPAKAPSEVTEYWASVLTKADATDQLASLLEAKLLVPANAHTEQMTAALAARAKALRELKTLRREGIGDTRNIDALEKARTVEDSLRQDAKYLDAMARFDEATKKLVALVNPHLVDGLKIDDTTPDTLRFTIARAAAFDGFVPSTAKELLALDKGKVPDEIHRFDDFPESTYAAHNYQLRKARFLGDYLVPPNEFGSTTSANHSGNDTAPMHRNNSAFISFSGSKDAETRFGNPGGTHIKLKLRELLQDIADGKVKGVDVLTHDDLVKSARANAEKRMKEAGVEPEKQNEIFDSIEKLAELSKKRLLRDEDFSEFNRSLPEKILVEKRAPPYLNALRHAIAADEFLLRGKIPKKYLTTETIPDR